MLIERVVHAPNGEDVLYVFYNRLTGDYVLMPYRLIAQKVEERISCNGFSLFPNGHLAAVPRRAGTAEASHDSTAADAVPSARATNRPDSGRRFSIRWATRRWCAASPECNEVLTLDSEGQSLRRTLHRSRQALRRHPRLLSVAVRARRASELDAALRQVREAADKAVDEFDKVRRLQREAVATRRRRCAQRCEERFQEVRRVELQVPQRLRGQPRRACGSCAANSSRSRKCATSMWRRWRKSSRPWSSRRTSCRNACVQFLLKPEALEPYRRQAAEHLATRRDRHQGRRRPGDREGGRRRRAANWKCSSRSSTACKIEDATETTRIIDGITAVYSTLNQVKAALKKRLQNLVASEGAAQFAAQTQAAEPVRRQLPRPLRHAGQVRGVSQPHLGAAGGTGGRIRRFRGVHRAARRTAHGTLRGLRAAQGGVDRAAQSPGQRTADRRRTHPQGDPKSAGRVQDHRGDQHLHGLGPDDRQGPRDDRAIAGARGFASRRTISRAGSRARNRRRCGS